MIRTEQLTSTTAITPVDDLVIAVRAYVPLVESERQRRARPQPQSSEWVLIFDTETTTDPSQRLRFGSQVGFKSPGFDLNHSSRARPVRRTEATLRL